LSRISVAFSFASSLMKSTIWRIWRSTTAPESIVAMAQTPHTNSESLTTRFSSPRIPKTALRWTGQDSQHTNKHVQAYKFLFFVNLMATYVDLIPLTHRGRGQTAGLLDSGPCAPPPPCAPPYSAHDAALRDALAAAASCICSLLSTGRWRRF
jgi:hypothetical protein